MKLQQIMTSLALEVMGGVEEKTIGDRGAKPERAVAEKILDGDLKLEKVHAIKPRDDLFWFNRPRLLLYLVHMMLFQVIFKLKPFGHPLTWITFFTVLRTPSSPV